MSWTKRLVIEQALEEIGIASYAFDSTAGQLASALRQLDAMMGTWIDRGIVFDPVYPLSTNPTVADLDEDTEAPAEALAPMYLNLAIRLAPSYGKTLSPRTAINAKASYSTLLDNYTVGREYSLGTFLKGAGSKRPIYPWTLTQDLIDESEEVVTP